MRFLPLEHRQIVVHLQWRYIKNNSGGQDSHKDFRDNLKRASARVNKKDHLPNRVTFLALKKVAFLPNT